MSSTRVIKPPPKARPLAAGHPSSSTPPAPSDSPESPRDTATSALADSGRRAIAPAPKVEMSDLIAYRLEGSRFKYHLPERIENAALSKLPPSDQRTLHSVRYQTTQKDLGYLPDSTLRPRGPSSDDKRHALDGRFTDTMVKIGFGRASNFMRVHKTSHRFFNANQGPAPWDTHRAH